MKRPTPRSAASGWPAALDLKPFRVYASDQAHSSIAKACVTLGLGLDGFRGIAHDADYRMDVAALEAAIAEDRAAGIRPLAVVATVGTTSTTSVDPVAEIGEVCRREDLWFHVDAAYAGSAALCPEHRWIFSGAEHVDSLVFNPHKWLFTPFDASALYTRHPEIFRRAFSLVPEYLTTPVTGQVVDLMDYGVQLGRRFRALKLWWVLRCFGAEGIRDATSSPDRHGRRLRRLGRCPSGLRADGADPVLGRLFPGPAAGTWSDPAAIDGFNMELMERVNASGEIYLSHTRLDDGIALRVAIGNLGTTEEDVRRCRDLLEKENDMPLPPLNNDETIAHRLWRNLRVAIPVAFWFGFLGIINLVQTLSLVIKPFSAAAFRRVNRWCANTWWGGCVVFAERFNGTEVIVSGEELPTDENVLVVSNHQQMPDITTIMALARGKGRLGDLKFFVKHALKWVPGVGWGMQFLNCPFLKRDWSADREQDRRHLRYPGQRADPHVARQLRRGDARHRGQDPRQRRVGPRTGHRADPERAHSANQGLCRLGGGSRRPPQRGLRLHHRLCRGRALAVAVHHRPGQTDPRPHPALSGRRTAQDRGRAQTVAHGPFLREGRAARGVLRDRSVSSGGAVGGVAPSPLPIPIPIPIPTDIVVRASRPQNGAAGLFDLAWSVSVSDVQQVGRTLWGRASSPPVRVDEVRLAFPRECGVLGIVDSRLLFRSLHLPLTPVAAPVPDS